eukprot:560212-Heterocapsa_arctica.AAC.1
MQKVARLTLQNTRDLRGHSACIRRVVLLPSDHAVALAMTAAGQSYHAQREKGAMDLTDKMEGASHHHAWAAMAGALADIATKPTSRA